MEGFVDELELEQFQEMLEDFGSEADAAPAKIAVTQSGSTQSDKPPLDGVPGVSEPRTSSPPRVTFSPPERVYQPSRSSETS